MILAKSPVSRIASHAVLLSGAIIMVFPFIWMVLASGTPESEIFNGGLLPVPTLAGTAQNYGAALTAIPLLRFMANGFVVCLAILTLQIAVAIPCGYALAKLSFPGRPLLLGAVLLGLLVPVQIPTIPIYVALAKSGLLDTYPALILPWIISVFAIFLFRQFFVTFPDEVLDAARLDGFSELSIAWRIMVPAAWPAVAAFSIFSIVAHWNDLYWPLVVTTNPDMMMPSLGIAYFRQAGDGGGQVGALMAGGVIVTAPLAALFLSMQRHFIRGLVVGRH
ncbi:MULTISPECIES: carbohydrate ABC transporter permease [Rhizobium]|uniref:sn-glycerol-3-phosphate transport system permease protein UgpE n=2 Tax=Rhizobium TaxID=379 RepID=A0A109JHN4_9HYPH|nr:MULTISPECIES: carbohydrate ABC transporter permease [Rhizobium]KWV49018.1 sugar ABC transporter permease [Rhizobium altiplani]KWV49128.1 sugar ABC transporter permease [Rhizobium altiplani]KWV58879.1 sugar ABC transporter permease [Rhizobium altiplani]CCM80125.1 Sugar ABC superfamily ATP binding cassette transporter, membrane protein [Rhizobium mesoamericanum STM3625]